VKSSRSHLRMNDYVTIEGIGTMDADGKVNFHTFYEVQFDGTKKETRLCGNQASIEGAEIHHQQNDQTRKRCHPARVGRNGTTTKGI